MDSLLEKNKSISYVLLQMRNGDENDIVHHILVYRTSEVFLKYDTLAVKTILYIISTQYLKIDSFHIIFNFDVQHC